MSSRHEANLTEHVHWLAQDERAFGPATAVKQFGRIFHSSGRRPSWLLNVRSRNSVANAVGYALQREDVVYAEGYAMNIDFPISMAHAWLVDHDGFALDLAWTTGQTILYFGIAFKRPVLERIKGDIASDFGLLHPHLIRHNFPAGDISRAVDKRFLPEAVGRRGLTTSRSCS